MYGPIRVDGYARIIATIVSPGASTPFATPLHVSVGGQVRKVLSN